MKRKTVILEPDLARQVVGLDFLERLALADLLEDWADQLRKFDDFAIPPPEPPSGMYWN